jgi:hypothetical protein
MQTRSRPYTLTDVGSLLSVYQRAYPRDSRLRRAMQSRRLTSLRSLQLALLCRDRAVQEYEQSRCRRRARAAYGAAEAAESAVRQLIGLPS